MLLCLLKKPIAAWWRDHPSILTKPESAPPSPFLAEHRHAVPVAKVAILNRTISRDTCTRTESRGAYRPKGPGAWIGVPSVCPTQHRTKSSLSFGGAAIAAGAIGIQRA